MLCTIQKPSISVVPVEPGLANMEKTDATGQRIVGLNTEHDEKYEMHRLIGALLSSELKEQEKLDIIEHEYNIPISQEFREDVSIMCNLSQGIEDKAIAKIVMNMYKIGYTPNQIADAVGVSVDEVETIIKKKEPAMA